MRKLDSSYEFTNWAKNLKQKISMGTFSVHQLYRVIKKLDPLQNYWLVIVSSKNPTTKHYLYDCKPKSVEAVLSISPSDFYIIEKKFRWLAYFELDMEKGEVALTKSGQIQTPFES